MTSAFLGLGPVLLTGYLLTGYLERSIEAHELRGPHGGAVPRQEFSALERRVDSQSDKLNAIYLSTLRDEILEYTQRICEGDTVPYVELRATALTDYNANSEQPFPDALLNCP